MPQMSSTLSMPLPGSDSLAQVSPLPPVRSARKAYCRGGSTEGAVQVRSMRGAAGGLLPACGAPWAGQAGELAKRRRQSVLPASLRMYL